MKERIENPYTFCPEEADLISGNYTAYKDWKKDCFNEIKQRIIEHLRKEQDNQCCYCKNELGYDIRCVEIEHIAPKHKYPAFGFENKNIALACPGCNTSKGKKNVLNKTRIKNYPKDSKNFTIVHPHYDNYSAHITIIDKIIYAPLDEKGCATISTCKLYRLKKVMEQAQKVNTGENENKALIEQARNSTSGSELNSILKTINNKLKEGNIQLTLTGNNQ